MKKVWNRCEDCGRFIAYEDFDRGAVRRLITPDSLLSFEEWETLCVDHANSVASSVEIEDNVC